MDCKWIFSSVFWALLCVLLSSRLSWDQFPHTHTEESVLHRGAQALVWFMHVVLCISLLYYVCVVSDTVSSDDKSLHSYQCNGGQWFWAQYFTTSHDVTSSLCVTPSLLACPLGLLGIKTPSEWTGGPCLCLWMGDMGGLVSNHTELYGKTRDHGRRFLKE